MHWQTDGPGVICDRSKYRLLYPPRSIGRKLKSFLWVKLFSGSGQPNHSFLDQISNIHTHMFVPLGNTHNETHVTLHHSLFCFLGRGNNFDKILGRSSIEGQQILLPHFGTPIIEWKFHNTIIIIIREECGWSLLGPTPTSARPAIIGQTISHKHVWIWYLIPCFTFQRTNLHVCITFHIVRITSDWIRIRETTGTGPFH
mmetsp:Transcript_25083/g.38330  ORF Transcript_25083/g.38330 Transcript_25083/m.38330 type:complete len:200 (+) Transcript_25083:542-1141(+)